MNIMISLAAKQLLNNKKRTLITIFSIVLSVAMVTAVAGFVVSTQDMMRRTYISVRGNYHALISPVTKEQAQALLLDTRVESGYTEMSADGERLMVLFRIKDLNRFYAEAAEKIGGDYGIENANFDFNKELLAAEGVADDESLLAVYSIAAILGMIILIGSIIVIANAFYISASERIVQFGILKSAGATKAQIRWTVLAEGFVLSIIAIPLGLLAGFGVEAAALAIANKLLYEISQLNRGETNFSMIFSGWAVCVSVAVSLVTVFLSAWFPASKAAKISAIEAITLKNEVNISLKDVKSSPIIFRLFGFEGVLAAKSLRRSRRKYRATVISLVVSIILFIMGSGFGIMMKQSADLVYRDFGVNVLMNYSNGSNHTISRINSQLAGLKGDLIHSETVSVYTDIPGDFLTPEGEQYLGWEFGALSDGTRANSSFIALDDTSFETVCHSAGVTGEKFSGEEYVATGPTDPISPTGNTLKGILVNKTVKDYAGKRIEFSPFQNNSGIALDFYKLQDGQRQRLEIVGQVSELPVGVAAITDFSPLNIIIPKKTFEEFSEDMQSNESFWIAKADNPTEYCKAAEEILSAYPEGTYLVHNYEQTALIVRNFNLLAMIFIYGFVGMLSLIAVTSVLGTISTNITLRLPEFAMLSSVGMTPEGLRRMLNLESLFYGFKALSIGLPISLVLYYLMYKAFGLKIGFGFIWPWQNMLVCTAAVLLITFANMSYSAKLLEGKNIIELIKKMF